jgi:hypothetical protein
MGLVCVLPQHVRQGLLNQVFGQLPITTSEPVEITEQWGVVARHQRGECHLVACLNRGHQLFIASLLQRARLCGLLSSCTAPCYEQRPQKVRQYPHAHALILSKMSALESLKKTFQCAHVKTSFPLHGIDLSITPVKRSIRLEPARPRWFQLAPSCALKRLLPTQL